MARQDKTQGGERCLIWSSAGLGRARALIRYHGLDAHFFGVFSSGKRDIAKELAELVCLLSLDSQEPGHETAP